MKAKILGMLAVALMAGPTAANAAVLYAFEEVGGNVVVTLSGSLNIIGLQAVGPFFSNTPGVASAGGVIATGVPNSAQNLFANVLSGPSSFGVGGFIPAQGFTGDAVFLHGFLGDLFLPFNYISGAPLNATLTFAGQTFSSMGLTAGRLYVYTLPTQDLLNILIGNSAPQVPEPGTLALLALGLTGLALSRSRRAN